MASNGHKPKVEENGNGQREITLDDLQQYTAKDQNLSPAEKFITELPDDKLNERTILSPKMISLMAIQITKEQAINPDRKKPLSQIWRENRQRLSLSNEGIARIQAIGILQSQKDVQDAEAALRD